jgi:leucyl/phenylalanyl-tRNA---protein transferase
MASICFPSPNSANEDGLVFVGGDVTKENILTAYRAGIFPWPVSINLPMTWFSPDPRGVLFCKDFKVNKTLKKFLKKTSFSSTFNQSFENIIYKCAEHHEFYKNNPYGTWITPEMIKGYTELFKSGNAYSIEVWDKDELVGGIYGVCINNFYSAESMFFTKPNASKTAIVNLIDFLEEKKINMLDIQMVTPTTLSFGAKEISRLEFLSHLQKLVI